MIRLSACCNKIPLLVTHSKNYYERRHEPVPADYYFCDKCNKKCYTYVVDDPGVDCPHCGSWRAIRVKEHPSSVEWECIKCKKYFEDYPDEVRT